MKEIASNLPVPVAVDRGDPPFRGYRIKADGWWGCPDWLIRGEPTREAKWEIEEPIENMSKFLADCIADQPGEPVEIGSPRFCRAVIHDEQPWALHPVSVTDTRGIQPVYLAFVEAVVQPDRWAWLNGCLGGIKDDELACFIAPVKISGWQPA